MLVLGRTEGQFLDFHVSREEIQRIAARGGSIDARVFVTQIKPDSRRCRLGIAAPHYVEVYRGEYPRESDKAS